MGLESLGPTEVTTASGEKVTIVTIGHASLLFVFQGKHIYVDPWSKMGDYKKLPKADVILITHDHFDHLDKEAVAAVRTPQSVLITNGTVGKALSGAIVLNNGQSRNVDGWLKVDAVPAYNLPERQKFHPKGRDNGYLLSLGGSTIYVSGDTEPQPEILALHPDVIFLPVNQPYTMKIPQAVETVKAMRPKVFYPYHYADTDVRKLKSTVEKEIPGVEVRLPKQNCIG
jgi:L-ascorbate metabolism protein UlaG (beta-lactamase superfamily)